MDQPTRPKTSYFARQLALCAALALQVGCAPDPADLEFGAWHPLQPGLELAGFAVGADLRGTGSMIRVLRIDPDRFELRLFNASSPEEGESRTAREWAERHGLVAAINAAMYQEDYRTSVSLMRTRDHANNAHKTRDMAILAFDPLDDAAPRVKIIDLECDRWEDWRERYGAMVQSIRMLSCTGRNVWSPQPRRSSTAAIGTDRQGRLLFVLARTPMATRDLIETLRELPLELDRLMYAEGGSEAQLFIRGPDRDYEIFGQFERGLDEAAVDLQPWPLPNVLGIVPRVD